LHLRHRRVVQGTRSWVVAHFHALSGKTQKPPRARGITKAFSFKALLRAPSWPWWLRFRQIEPLPLRWCFPDEENEVAQHVAEMLNRGDMAIAPAFWPHEVLNALLVGEKRKRISRVLMRRFLDDLATLQISLEQFPAKAVFDRIRDLSREHGLTAYDAAYLDLSVSRGLPLATLDADLIKACRKGGVKLIQG